jgi:hypothetical protein
VYPALFPLTLGQKNCGSVTTTSWQVNLVFAVVVEIVALVTKMEQQQIGWKFLDYKPDSSHAT